MLAPRVPFIPLAVALALGVGATSGACDCSPAGPPGLRAVTTSGGGTEAQPLALEVTLEVVGGPAEAEARVLVGLPHWYYGMRRTGAPAVPTVTARGGDARLPARLEARDWGRWYAVATLDRDVPPGGRITLSLKGAPPVGVPGELLPRVFFDPHGGDDPVPVADVAPVFVGPASRPPARTRRTAPVLASGRRVVFADLHGHSALSDGRGTPGSYFAFARGRGNLDVAALSDHDWQVEPAELVRLVEAADAADAPGEFVALPALETNLHGHEVAWFLDSEALRAVAGAGAGGGATTLAEETDFGRPAATFRPRMRELLRRLEGSVLTASHTPLAPGMGTPAARPDALPGEACVEIYSAHGSSECNACDRAVGTGASPGGEPGPVSDVRAQLARDPTLCLLAAGDSHDGRPGDTRWGPHPGGLTGLEVDELTRAGVFRALRAGRTWATTGGRTVLELDEAGGRLRVADAVPTVAVTLVDAATGVETELVRGDRRGTWIDLPGSPPGRGRYVRVTLEDGSAAWINPLRRGEAPAR